MMAPSRAMILAAGRGMRMRPISDHTPKPLIEIGGRSMLDRMLDRFHGFGTVVVNAWHLAGRIADALEQRGDPAVVLSRESDLLDTGGGVLNALDMLGADPFVVANGDVLIAERGTPALEILAAAWDERRMDALLLLVPTAEAGGFRGAGDFFLDEDHRPVRRGEAPHAPFVYASLQIVHPRLLRDAPEPPFSFNLLWDKALAAGRLFGVQHDGGCFTVDTPENLEAAERWLKDMT
ncbi:MAG: nucleotidyltransferase family protein [Rhodospirillales bacterium]|nr:nucleotidyltransferase family protein [Rhodospirillales bacterium]